MNLAPFFISALAVAAIFPARAEPVITRQPLDFSVSLGANVTNQVTATGSGSLAYQWRQNNADLPGATNRTLVLTNVQPANGGSYTVIVTDAVASAVSRTVMLEVDPTFTKVTTGPVVTDRGEAWGASWADYDGDGDYDLFVARNQRQGNRLYRNNGDGTFAVASSMDAGVVVNDRGTSLGAVWADADNDGLLDLFVANGGVEPAMELNFFYRGGSSGQLARATAADAGTIVSDRGTSSAPVWADYDNDGWIDLFMPNFDRPAFLYRNLGAGKFERMNLSPLTTESGFGVGASWGDYDNDGDLDLFVANVDVKNFLYRNEGNGTFAKITDGPVVNDIAWAFSGVWGDYDNDGFLDLFVANWNNKLNALYHNNRDGTFTKVIAGEIVNERGYSVTASWADYDNDGWLDLFVANGAPSNRRNYLFHNNGDGTFTKVRSGSPSNEGQTNVGCAWADYDRDGFLDLFVSGGANEGGSNYLYRNNGNSNHWLHIRLVGTRSNRSAIGAKVRVQATIQGKTFWQLREISGGHGHGGVQESLDAEFGLGDATLAEIVRIEWPSGAVQELRSVAARQFLQVMEPVNLQVSGPGQFQFRSWINQTFGLEASTDLAAWLPVTTLTNLNGLLEVKDSEAVKFSQRFYRVRAR